MAASKMSLVEQVKEDFCSCPICQEPFKYPKMLPCLHSYCRHCLERHINTQAVGGVFRCPVCNRQIKADNGIETFLDNFFIAGLTEKLLPATIKPKCHVCQVKGVETDSTSQCIDCEDYLCTPCAEKHTFSRLTQNHKVLLISEIQSGKYDAEIKSKQKVYCQHHNDEVLKFQCKKCQVPICVICKTIDHDDHKCTTLENGVKEVKPVIESSVTELQSKVPMYSKLIDVLDQDTIKLDKTETFLSNNIKTKANDICASVRKQEKEMLQDVARRIDIQRKQIEACKEKLEVTISIIQSSSDVATKILTYGKDAEILLYQHQLTARIQELQESPTVELPAQIKMTLKTISSGEVDSAIKNGLGKLEIVKLDRDVRMYRDVGKVTPKIKDTPELKLEFKTGIQLPFGITVNNASDMLVTDAGNSVHVYSKLGAFKHKFGNFNGTTDVLSLPDGKVVVSDYGADKVVVLSGDKTISEIPMPNCHGIAINKLNHIAIACGVDKHVSIVQLDGTVIRKIDKHNGKDLFEYPHYVAFTSQGNLVVSDEVKHTITVLSPDGVPMYTYGSQGSGERQLNRPIGVCVDGYDNIIIADCNNNRIHLLGSDGKFVKYLATQKDGLKWPYGVVINNDGDLVVTQGGGEVKVFKYLE